MDILQGLELQVVENVEEAEFILAHGTEALGHPSGAASPKKLEELENILERCAAKSIPMVVANPDFVTVEARALRLMPGRYWVWSFGLRTYNIRLMHTIFRVSYIFTCISYMLVLISNAL